MVKLLVNLGPILTCKVCPDCGAHCECYCMDATKNPHLGCKSCYNYSQFDSFTDPRSSIKKFIDNIFDFLRGWIPV